MEKWSHIILEVFCLRTSDCRKGKYLYEIVNEDEFVKGETMKTKRVPNLKYDPNYRTPRKPSYCPSTPSYVCLEKDCPYLGYSNADEDDYKWLWKRYEDKK